MSPSPRSVSPYRGRDRSANRESYRNPSPPSRSSQPPKGFMNPERERMLSSQSRDDGGKRYTNNRNNNDGNSHQYHRDSDRSRDRRDSHPNHHHSPQNNDGYRDNGRKDYNRPNQSQQSAEYFELRKRQREASDVTVWARSPDVVPLRDASPVHRLKSRKRSKHDTETDSASESDTSDNHRNKRRGQKKRERSSRSHKSKKSKSKKSRSKSSHRKESKKSRSARDSDDSSIRSNSQSDSESNESRTSPARSDSDKRQRDAKGSDNGVAKPSTKTKVSKADGSDSEIDEHDRSTIQDYWREKEVQHTDDAPVGPMPLSVTDKHLTEHDYGGALLAGEGSAMAAFLQSGKRIPRRGEIGLTSEEIVNYEDAGFVMSGSRHQRMNAVRIRKENQVISAEEKKALLMFSQEANMKKEAEIIGTFKELVANKLRGKNADEA
ncbi:hypothetical protein O5D80_005180 [Batrachochytrium dendrobatidis]|nr:hypothetical protein O5D80_005180 [Batrachochytrium dendrobatidis]